MTRPVPPAACEWRTNKTVCLATATWMLDALWTGAGLTTSFVCDQHVNEVARQMPNWTPAGHEFEGLIRTRIQRSA